MNAITILSLFTLGLAGSLHCVGMCGPLVMAMPFDKSGIRLIVKQQLVYHSFRILTYSALGAVIGLLSSLLYINKIQIIVTIIIGLFLVFMSIGGLLKINFSIINSWSQKSISKIFNSIIKYRGFRFFALAGMLNGLVPCGLVYTAMAISFFNQTWFSGLVGMAAFGFGTLPLLFAFLISTSKVKGIKNVLNTKYVMNSITLVAGLVMIYKSVNTLLPPETSLWQAVTHPIMCHGK